MGRVSLYFTVLLLFLCGMSETSNAVGEPDIFGMEVGNTWTYQRMENDGPHFTRDKVVTKESHGSRNVYVFERWENGVRTETQWLERTPGMIKLWGGTADFGGPAYTMQFSKGLLQAWYPMYVGESRYTSASLTIKELPGKLYQASMRIEVIGEKQVPFFFGTVLAHRMRCQMRVWGNGADETVTFIQWNVPYLGCAKYEEQGSIDKLVSFSIGGGSITHHKQKEKPNDTNNQPILLGCQKSSSKSKPEFLFLSCQHDGRHERPFSLQVSRI